MAKITIDGRTFDLVMSIYAMGQIEEEFGDLKQALEKFRKGSRDIKIIRTMFRILANAGQHKAKQPMDVTGEEINDLNLAGLEKLSLTMRAAMDEAMKAETVDGGLADDSEVLIALMPSRPRSRTRKVFLLISSVLSLPESSLRTDTPLLIITSRRSQHSTLFFVFVVECRFLSRH